MIDNKCWTWSLSKEDGRGAKEILYKQNNFEKGQLQTFKYNCKTRWAMGPVLIGKERKKKWNEIVIKTWHDYLHVNMTN